MDTSETYIKMCEKAVEIQAAKPQLDPIGSVFWDAVLPYRYCPQCDTAIDSKHCPDCGTAMLEAENPHRIATYRTISPFQKGVWLPRQDQLQKMVVGTFMEKLDRFVLFYGTYPIFPEGLGLSMEQLWLAFVMSEKYNKRWNGEDWL